MGITARHPRQKQERICAIKSRTTFEEPCNSFPAEFIRYFRIVRDFRFPKRQN
jgi:hypothetical protein